MNLHLGYELAECFYALESTFYIPFQPIEYDLEYGSPERDVRCVLLVLLATK